jgi:formylglycine-generating enzyme required for sulfatase activity
MDWNKWYEDKGYEVASTTMVGQFLDGNSASGASDMSGNVWEWTNSWYDQGIVYHSVHGGSWYGNGDGARCAGRGRFVPDNFNYNVGFRVVSPGIFLDSGS